MVTISRKRQYVRLKWLRWLTWLLDGFRWKIAWLDFQPVPPGKCWCKETTNASLHILPNLHPTICILNVGNVHRVQRWCIRPNCRHLIPMFDRNGFCPARFPCRGNGSPDEILSICLAQENREMYPYIHSGKLYKNEIASSVRQWTLVALVKKTSLHCECWKTADGLTRAGYNMMSLLGLLYSHSDFVFFIQSNCIELQPSIHILIWVTFRSSCTSGMRSGNVDPEGHCCCWTRVPHALVILFCVEEILQLPHLYEIPKHVLHIKDAVVFISSFFPMFLASSSVSPSLLLGDHNRFILQSYGVHGCLMLGNRLMHNTIILSPRRYIIANWVSRKKYSCNCQNK
jgi:hypothetical protein